MKKLDIGRYSFESPNKAELHEDSLEIVKKVNEIIHWISEQSEPVELPKEEKPHPCICTPENRCIYHYEPKETAASEINTEGMYRESQLKKAFEAGRKEGVENTIKEVKALIRLSKTEWQAMDDLLRDLSH